MGHVGLTPQTATALGGYKAQGRNADAALRVAEDALALQEAGCFAIVFEAIPSAVSEELMYAMEIPVIGIGAGAATDGQVLVFHDLLGINEGGGARFVKRYGDLMDDMVRGVSAFADDVRGRRYPEPEHTYSIDPRRARRLPDTAEGGLEGPLEEQLAAVLLVPLLADMREALRADERERGLVVGTDPRRAPPARRGSAAYASSSCRAARAWPRRRCSSTTA